MSFHVPREIWQMAVNPHWQNSVLCLMCFISQADEKLIRWEQGIRFLPTSLRTQLEDVVGVKFPEVDV